MAKLEVKVRENPKLEQRVLDDGRVSLYLEYYLGREEEFLLDSDGNRVLYDSGKMKGKPRMIVRHKRKKESLGLFLHYDPKNAQEKRENRDVMALAMKIRAEKEQCLLLARDGMSSATFNSNNVFEYFDLYIQYYSKADKRNVRCAYQSFRRFLAQSKLYRYVYSLTFDKLTKDMMVAYVDYLQKNHKGEGAKSYYKRFKKVLNHAKANGVLCSDPCKGVIINVDENRLAKDVLSEEEIMVLLNTKVKGMRSDIRRAFVFCLYTGMRFCDVKELTYRSIDRANKRLNFEQNKTVLHSSSSSVTMPLSDCILAVVGEPEKSISEKVFDLPSHNACLKALRKWTECANIKKHITWHCARHSFSVNILTNGANIKTLQGLLGHTTLRYTEKYTRVVDKLKNEAIDSLMTFDASQL